MQRGRLEMLLVGHTVPLRGEARTGRATTEKGLLFNRFNPPTYASDSYIFLSRYLEADESST